MIKDATIFLKHILESIEKIEEYMKGKTKSEFVDNEQLQDAVIRRLEIIGEATKNISTSFRNKHPNIEWQGIAGLRDKLIHHYFGIDLDLTYKTIKEKVPELKEKIEEILEEEKAWLKST